MTTMYLTLLKRYFIWPISLIHKIDILLKKTFLNNLLISVNTWIKYLCQKCDEFIYNLTFMFSIFNNLKLFRLYNDWYVIIYKFAFYIMFY